MRSPQTQTEKMMKKETDMTKTNYPKVPCRELLGALQYLVTRTRPDIANAVWSLVWHTDAYTTEYYTRSKRVLRLLRGTRNFELVYRRSDALPPRTLQVCSFSDAEHTNFPNTSRSLAIFVVQLNAWSFRFKSKTQKAITDDTCKSELTAASMCVE